MRLFKHGDSLAIVIPPALAVKLAAKENQEFEFFELNEGALVLVKREALAKQVKGKTLMDLARLATSGQTASTATPSSLSSTAVSLPPLMVFSSEVEAKQAARKFEQELKRGDLIGVTGTDKKVYVLSAAFYTATAAKLMPLLEKEKTLAELCTASSLPPRDVFATLQAMKEKGDVIEKKKGSYLLVK